MRNLLYVMHTECVHGTCHGCRRVHTMMLPVLSELSELYRAADGGATACLLAKLGVEKSLLAKLEDTRQALTVRACCCLHPAQAGRGGSHAQQRQRQHAQQPHTGALPAAVGARVCARPRRVPCPPTHTHLAHTSPS